MRVKLRSIALCVQVCCLLGTAGYARAQTTCAPVDDTQDYPSRLREVLNDGAHEFAKREHLGSFTGSDHATLDIAGVVLTSSSDPPVIVKGLVIKLKNDQHNDTIYIDHAMPCKDEQCDSLWPFEDALARFARVLPRGHPIERLPAVVVPKIDNVLFPRAGNGALFQVNWSVSKGEWYMLSTGPVIRGVCGNHYQFPGVFPEDLRTVISNARTFFKSH